MPKFFIVTPPTLRLCRASTIVSHPPLDVVDLGSQWNPANTGPEGIGYLYVYLTRNEESRVGVLPGNHISHIEFPMKTSSGFSDFACSALGPEASK